MPLTFSFRSRSRSKCSGNDDDDNDDEDKEDEDSEATSALVEVEKLRCKSALPLIFAADTDASAALAENGTEVTCGRGENDGNAECASRVECWPGSVAESSLSPHELW